MAVKREGVAVKREGCGSQEREVWQSSRGVDTLVRMCAWLVTKEKRKEIVGKQPMA